MSDDQDNSDALQVWKLLMEEAAKLESREIEECRQVVMQLSSVGNRAQRRAHAAIARKYK